MPVKPSDEGWGVEFSPPLPNTNNQAAAGWPDTMEELVNNSVIVDEHCALMGAVLQGVRSVHTGLNGTIQGLLIGCKVSQVMLLLLKTDLAFS